MWIFWVALIGAAIWYFRRKKNSPRATKPPQDSVTAAPDQDAWEGTFYDAHEQRSAKKTVQLQYTDGQGATTERKVDIKRYEPQGRHGLVIGYCHFRNATRTFRFDRMTRVIDLDTGEIIPDLQKRLNDEWSASPEPLLDQLYREQGDVLKLLLYMAKADGAVRAAEIGVIAQHCQAITGDSRITPDLIKDLLKAVDVVTITTFTRLYNKLRRERPDDAVKAADACRAIVATQKSIHPNEQSALDILEKPLP